MKTDLPETWAEVVDDVLPVLRRLTDPPASVQAEVAASGVQLIARPVGRFLVERLVYNGDGYRLYLNQSHLDAWGVSAEQCFASALDILDPSFGLVQLKRGVWSLESGDGYESSRPLIPGWLRAFVKDCVGAPVVLIPHIRRVLVVDSASIEALVYGFKLSQREFETEANPLSPRPYAEDSNGRLDIWSPSQDHPLQPYLEDSARRLMQYECNNQRYILDGEGGMNFSKVDLIRMPTSKRLRTLVWCRDVSELLAPADFVGLMFGEGEKLVIGWDAFLEVASHCLLPLGWTLERYRLLSWPDAMTLSKLRARGVGLQVEGSFGT